MFHSLKKKKKETWKIGEINNLKKKNKHWSVLMVAVFTWHYIGEYSSVGKECASSAGDPGSVPRWRRSPGEGIGSPLQYSCLENPADRGSWQATICGVARVRHYWELSTYRGTEQVWDWSGFLLSSYKRRCGVGVLKWWVIPGPRSRMKLWE